MSPSDADAAARPVADLAAHGDKRRAVAEVTRVVVQLHNERSALLELKEQLLVDEASLTSCIEVVAAECERLTDQLEDADRHVADVERQLALSANEEQAATLEFEAVSGRMRSIVSELEAFEGELGSYRTELALARGLLDTTFERTLQMRHKLRHGSGALNARMSLDTYGEDDWS